MQQKPILCFYIGYTLDVNKNNNYGSELALIKLAEQFTNYFNVFVFGQNTYIEIIKNNVTYLHSNKLNSFQNSNTIEVMIISRYIHFFLEFESTAKKTFLWVHDVTLNQAWDYKSIPHNAKFLLKNVIHKIDCIVTLCEWHKNSVIQHYEIDPAKVVVIGNAIDSIVPEETPIQNRFIYTSCALRGIEKLMEYFHEIHQHIPDVELYIYRGRESFTDEILNEIQKYDYIHFMGKLDNHQLLLEFLKADFWFYPTHFTETYCISALEAQLTGTVCIASDLAALTTTVDDRGILLKSPVHSEDYKQEAISSILDLIDHPSKKEEYRRKGREWAKLQTWENRMKEWMSLF
jgi:glycosyltransferase involved in cell wall biosynthesis